MKGGSIRVLHVDDEPEFGEMAGALLEREDERLEVETATSAADGLQKLADDGFDGVVSDYDMPGRNGIEFLEAVRDRDLDLPFILFTGKGSEEIASEAISAGVSDYLQKAIGTDQYTILANRIANAVDRHRVRRQIDLRHEALETASEGLSLVNPDGTFMYVNSAFARLFGYEQSDLVGVHWRVLYHDEEAKRLEHRILPAVLETGYWAGETVRTTKRGEKLVTDHRLTSAGEDIIVCTAKDLTERRAASGTAGKTYELLLDSIGQEGYVFFTLDHEGYVTRWSNGAERLYGYDADDVLGGHLSTLLTGSDGSAAEDLLDTAWSEGSITRERPLGHEDERQVRAQLRISASHDNQGTLRGFGVVTHPAAEQPTGPPERDVGVGKT
jgi:PAS domain S-box-containing protein